MSIPAPFASRLTGHLTVPLVGIPTAMSRFATHARDFSLSLRIHTSKTFFTFLFVHVFYDNNKLDVVYESF